MKQPILVHIRMPFASRRPSFSNEELIEGRNSGLLRSYMLAAAVELKANAEEFRDCEVAAIRLDGGSASICDGRDLERLLRVIRAEYNIGEDLKISMRACPSDINGANMPFFNRAGIDRYDLEIYSLEPQDFITLDTLNYIDELPYISKGFLHADSSGKMGFILLYGKRNISRYGFRRSVLETIRRPVSHVIFQKCSGDDTMSDDECSAQLKEAAELLTGAGYTEYLPQHWAKQGCEDKFLSLRRQGIPVLGIGLGAETVIEGIRTVNTGDIGLYLQASGDFSRITVKAEHI